MTRRESTAKLIDEHRTHEWVDATTKGNVWAGVGAALLVVSGVGAWCLFVGRPFADYHILAALLAGLGWFALLCLVRFSIDELREKLDEASTIGLLAQQAEEIHRQKAEIADLRAENKRISAMLRGQEFQTAAKGARSIVTAEDSDAERTLRHVERILQTWKNGNQYGRDYCKAMGMTRPDWEAAVMLMQKAGVMGKGGPGNQQWIVTANNYSDAVSRTRERAGLRTRTEGSNFVAA